MKRREMLKALLAAQLHSAQAGNPAVKPKRKVWPPSVKRTDGGEMPNILWICSDQQRYDTLEGVNNSHVHTPNLRELTEQSVTFTHAFVQNPVCSPSRASFLTGRYPHTTGLRANGQKIRATERLVTRMLADYGYECGLVGKLHLSPGLEGRTEERIDDGYDLFSWSWSPWAGRPETNQYFLWLTSKGIKVPQKTEIPSIPGMEMHNGPYGFPIDPKLTQTAWCADTAIEFINTHGTLSPWLFSVNWFSPHHPFAPPNEYYDRYDPAKLPSPPYRQGELKTKSLYQRIDHEGSTGGRSVSFTRTDDLTHRKITAAYYAMIEEVDFHVGRILKALEDSGQADNTIVIYSADHGEMLGDHGIYLKGPHFYEGAVRIPFIVRWPGRYKAGLKTDALVEMVDVVPTLLEACGIPVPQGVQGKSLTALLKGDTTTHRDSIYSEYYDSAGPYDPPPMVTMVRTAGHKLIYYHSLEFAEMYDLEKDPGELENIWARPGAHDARDMMTVKMINRMAETVDALPVRLGEG
jgi:arylsulfatase